VNAFEAYSVQRPFRQGAKCKYSGSCRSLTARVTINAPSERRTQELSPSYRTMPISLAASSQTQIGSSPFSNFRQRLSHQLRHKIANRKCGRYRLSTCSRKFPTETEAPSYRKP
jgi:hypothetical protein